MPFRFQCPDCDEIYQLKDTLAGRTVRCRVCNEKLTFPRADGSNPETDHLDDDDDGERLDTDRRREKAVVPDGKEQVARGHKKNDQTILWLLGGAGCTLLMVVLICGAAITYGVIQGAREVAEEDSRLKRERDLVASLASRGDIPEGGRASDLFPIDRYPLPDFPELDAGERIPDSNVTVRSIVLQPPAAKALLPSFAMQMRIYMPAGRHPPGSLPLVLIAPTGTWGFNGCELDSPDYDIETLPYAKAGAVVILFSLDGWLKDVGDLQNASEAEMSAAYIKFRAAGAGTVNARTALEFALAKIPAVDPKRIVIAGRSSAGTLAMLFAAHEPRLAAAIGYFPFLDMTARLQKVVDAVKGKPEYPEMSIFAEKSSPQRHAAQVHCPTFLVYATDDDEVPYHETHAFISLLRSFGKDTELSEPVVLGGRTEPMFTEGIPRAIRWLQKRGILPSDTP